jgi:hypothetical protein
MSGQSLLKLFLETKLPLFPDWSKHAPDHQDEGQLLIQTNISAPPAPSYSHLTLRASFVAFNLLLLTVSQKSLGQLPS